MAQTSPRGVHDLGGLPGHEPIDREPHHDHSFEARTAAMLALLRHPARPLVIVDEMRRGIESLNADEYSGYSYYERWLESARRILLEKGVLDEAELQRKIDEVRRRLEGQVSAAAPAAPKPKAGAPATKPKRRAAATAAKAPKRRSAAKRAAKRAAAPKRKAARKAVASRKPVAKAKPAAKRAAAKRTAAKRTVASKRAAPKRKPAPKRAASKRKAPARRKAAPKRAAARKTGAKGKPAARRTRR